MISMFSITCVSVNLAAFHVTQKELADLSQNHLPIIILKVLLIDVIVSSCLFEDLVLDY